MHPNELKAILDFWAEFDAKTYDDLSKISESRFKSRHRNVLTLCDKYSPERIAWLIAGNYYGHVWAKKSTSRLLSEYMMGVSDYTEFYGCAQLFYYITTMRSAINADFDKMDAIDRANARNTTASRA
jgi:hypothetical protein